MRVLIADKFEQSGATASRPSMRGTLQPGTKDDALVAAIQQSRPDVLVVRSTKVTPKMLEAGALKLVVRRAPATTRSTSPPPRAAESTSRTAGQELHRGG